MAEGTSNLGDRSQSHELVGYVHINGQLVGTTPYSDALPPGDYTIEIRLKNFLPLRHSVSLVPEKGSRVKAIYWLKLTGKQLAKRDAYRRERAQALAAKRRAERDLWEASRKEAEAHALRAWQAETREARASRSWRRTVGYVALATGIAVAGGGAVALVLASETDDKADEAFSRWQRNGDAVERDALASEVSDLEGRRDTEALIGTVLLVSGLAGVAFGSAMFWAAPEIPPPPGGAAALQVRPLLGLGSAGARLTGAF